MCVVSAQPLSVVDQRRGDLQGYVPLHAVTNDVLVTECACLTESNLEFNQNLEVCLCVELETDSLCVEQVTVAS